VKQIARPRRSRRTQQIRDLVAETRLSAHGLIQPYFVCDGSAIHDPIPGLPGIFRESVDSLIDSVAGDLQLGIHNIMLFGVTEHKDARGSYAANDRNPVLRAVRQLKELHGERLFISADVCLCAYTDTGHCGIVSGTQVQNDESTGILAAMATALAKEGCDCVAPSDMMDGRVGVIRNALEEHGYQDTLIMAYTAKYSSSYYGPFREAAKSSPGFGDRRGYQMDFRNRREARRELALDTAEGADIVMVKPALAYLDVIADFAAGSSLPVAAYNVSGEYAAVKLLAQAGLADEGLMVTENLTAIARAGASIILTYHFRDMLHNGWLNA
jgi:porphobilinogen synthase